MIQTLKALNPLKLIALAWRQWTKAFIKILLLTAIVALPGSLLQAASLGELSDVAILASFAGLYLSVALVWIYFHPKELDSSGIAKLYVRSSARFLPYLAVSLIFTLLSLPSLLGVFIVILALSGEVPIALTLFGICLSLSVVYFLIRFSLASFLVVQNDISAFGSLQLSWQITAKKTLVIGLAWLSIFVLIALLATAVFSLADLITILRENTLMQGLLSGLVLTIVLPLFFSYGVCLAGEVEAL